MQFRSSSQASVKYIVSGKIKVEVTYALPKKQYLISVILRNNSTVEEVVKLSGLLNTCLDIDLKKNKVGIYGHLVKLTDIVKDGDRVEIYRPLTVDPKEWRRLKAKRQTSSFS